MALRGAVGHSMGGDVIVEAVRRLPGRVKALFWVDTYGRLGAPRTPEQVSGDEGSVPSRLP